MPTGGIDPDSPVPLYHQLSEYVHRLVSSGLYKPAAQIPTEGELARQFRISRTTVRLALRELERRGVLIAYRGRGRFVKGDPIEFRLTRLRGLAEELESHGKHVSSKVLRVEATVPPDVVARALRIPDGEPVTFIERVRLAEGVPIFVVRSFLPTEIGERVIKGNLEVEPLFSLLERTAGGVPRRARLSISAGIADTYVAKHLNIGVGAPVILVSRTTFGSVPLMHQELLARPDKVQYTVDLERDAGSGSLLEEPPDGG